MSPKTDVSTWERFCRRYTEFPEIGLAIDLSRMNFSDDFIRQIEPRLAKAFTAMDELEAGAIANPDENRMVGHYWLRNAALAPTQELRTAIDQTVASIKAFAAKVHDGEIRGAEGPFEHFLIIGIGGSALGPQFVSHALTQPGNDKMTAWFIDNTDPDGIDQIKAKLAGLLGKTLVIVVSKSGETKETRNGMLEIQSAFREAELNFVAQAIAVTGEGSNLDKVAKAEGWIQRFPMWDWVGGRTSETSAVGLLPAALQGFDIDQLLAGAAECDNVTRNKTYAGNPAAQLAAAWYHAVDGRGSKDMVILPYKDRLELFPKYLQQLIMESLGKEFDLDGQVVNQGITVYGNKGSTDQHAYIQQLREGVHNFFATFIRVLTDRDGASMEVEKGITTGDYLDGLYQGTRDALYQNNRQSITVTVDKTEEYNLGVLIALYERTVGFYSCIVNINSYHQPGVQAGKKAAGDILQLQSKIIDFLNKNSNLTHSITAIAEGIRAIGEKEKIYLICQHLSAQKERGIKKTGSSSLETVSYQVE
ncbi:MAG: glucose-6-phosphate isomerase [Verrucomicrobia bacterium]|nr:glucose-6-phosphate isomerase [Verrucomicrobiota bacterium]